MPTLTLRANVWEQVKNNLPEQYDKLDARIQREVEGADNWREEIPLSLNDTEFAEVNRIIEEEDLNTD